MNGPMVCCDAERIKTSSSGSKRNKTSGGGENRTQDGESRGERTSRAKKEKRGVREIEEVKIAMQLRDEGIKDEREQDKSRLEPNKHLGKRPGSFFGLVW
jgi:ribosomal protein L35